ncbi:NmrA family NAD(P)-binding protein [Stackebrandtia nassauensis]|uniref:NmrA family protein n=1 Tax=Stackebrandtia nassauensis (strain DSM 44728 / CIP 108903 / NRRL B-16338 / NBRC 102104 / LLR-40K-21) TaxID=446470 RepID=D3PVG0_STANL|nr:NmrA family NAD(P)-binding protein [Stackebrandtia nassauensis]ADD43074.1 NmrA family protein [Stackebrandtia nassauensis DSM 44728]
MTRVLVAGATGRQGGAVVDRLRQRGHEPVAYVRDPDSDAAKALARDGVRLATGDLADAEALTRAAKGADAIFGLTVPFGENGTEEEIAQGRALADAAAAVDAHLVYSSVKGANGDVDVTVEHASAKQIVHRYLVSQGLRFTGIQPSYFMENALNVGFTRLNQGVYAFPLTADRKLDQVTTLDIAGMAVHAIENAEALNGRAIDVVSETLTSVEVAAVLSEVIGKDLPYEQIPIPMIRQWAGDETAELFQRFEDNREHTDVAALRAEFPDIGWHSYRDWAKTVDWDQVLAQKPEWG